MIRNWLDAMSMVRFNPNISNIDSSNFNSGASINVGDVNITITEASFKDDADYELVAQRVGDAFVKELNKQGLMTTTYSF